MLAIPLLNSVKIFESFKNEIIDSDLSRDAPTRDDTLGTGYDRTNGLENLSAINIVEGGGIRRDRSTVELVEIFG